jgi:hypothetical protein
MVLFSLHKKNAISRRSQSELQTMNGDPLYCRTLKGNDRAQSAVACVKRGAGEDEASDGASAQRMAYGLADADGLRCDAQRRDASRRRCHDG